MATGRNSSGGFSWRSVFAGASVLGMLVSVLTFSSIEAAPDRFDAEVDELRAALEDLFDGTVSVQGEPAPALPAATPPSTAQPQAQWAVAAASGAAASVATLPASTLPSAAVDLADARPAATTGAVLAAPVGPGIVTVDAIGRPTDSSTGHDVTLAWAPFSDEVAGYVVTRGGDELVELAKTETSFTDSARQPGELVDYEVLAVLDDDSRVSVGTVSVLIPALDRTCAMSWTGAGDSDWSNVDNWAPVVDLGSPAPAQLAPTQDDHVCIDLDAALPVVSSAANSAAAQVSSTLPVGTVTLSVAAGTLAVLDTLALGAVKIAGGTLEVKGAATFGATATGSPTLILDGGTLDLASNSSIGGIISATSATTTITSSAIPGPTITSPADAFVFESIGGSIIGDRDVTFQALEADITDITLADGPNGGATLDAIFLGIIDGKSLIDWGVTASYGVDVEAGASATITDFVSLRSDTSYEGGFFIDGGDLTLTQPITEFGNGDSFVRIFDGTLTINGATANDWAGVERMQTLELATADVTIPGDLTFDFITVEDSTLTATGDLVFSRGIELRDGGRIDATTVTTENARSYEGNIRVTGNSEIVGDVQISGDVAMNVTQGEGDADSHRLRIDGDLTLEPTSGVRSVLNTDGSSNLDITGLLTADGKLTVTINDFPPGTLEELLIRAGSTTGDFDEVEIRPAASADDVEVVKEDDEYILRENGGGGPGDGCADVPTVANMEVTGCWNDVGGGVYQTDPTDVTGPVMIGAVTFDLAADHTIALDTGDLSLTSQNAASERVAVPMSVPIVRESGAEYDEIARLRLGEIELDSWSVETELELALEDLLGLPINGRVTLSAGDGFWNLDVPTKLPEFLDLDTLFDFDVEPVGLRDEQIGLDELEVVVGELFGLSDIQLDWVSDRVWSIVSADNGAAGPAGFARAAALDASAIGIDGTIDFDPVGTGGIINVRGMVVADLVKIPDFSIGFVRSATTDSWLFTGGETSAIRRIAFTYARNGALQRGDIFLGDELGEDHRDSVAKWGEWLDVDALEISTDDAESWSIEGRIGQPEVDVVGRMTTDRDGNVVAASLEIDDAELGAVARFDMTLTLDTVAEHYTIDATLVGAGFEDRNGSGFIALDDGDLTAARLDFVELPLGELATLESAAIVWIEAEGHFSFEASVRQLDDTTSSISGTLTFTGGVLTGAVLTVDRLSFGLISIDELKIVLERSIGEVRSSRFALTGNIRGPITDAGPTAADVEGVMLWEDGELIELDLDVPLIDVGVARLTGLTFSYAVVDDTASVSGAGLLETADGATQADVTYGFTMRDGEMLDGSVMSNEISFGDIITIEDFALTYNAERPAPACEELGATSTAALWAVSGTTTTLAATTTVDGCLALIGERVVAGSLEVGDLRVGSLFTITDLTLTVDGVNDVEVLYPFGPRLVPVTTFDLEAQWIGPGGGITEIDGAMTIYDGGLAQLELSIPLLPITNVIRLADLRFSYEIDKPWQNTPDTDIELSGTLLNGPDVSTFAGTATFGDGRLDALSIDVQDVDFGIFQLDRLSFVYDGNADDTIWAFDGEVTDPTGTTTIDGDLVLDNGQVQSGSLQIDRLGIAGVVQMTDLSLAYSRAVDSETWTGSADVVVSEGAADANITFTFGDGGRLTDGEVVVDRLVWGDLVRVDNFSLVKAGDAWDIRGSYVPRNGPTSDVTGSMTIVGGQVVAGDMDLSGVRIGAIATIDRLELDVQDVADVTSWSATLTLDNGTTGSGAMVWDRGELTEASFALGEVSAGGLFTIDDLSVVYDRGSIWATTGTVTASGETTEVGGKLTFFEGEIVGGGVALSNFRFGPLDLEQLTLVVGDEVEVGNSDLDIGSICGVPDTGSGGTRWGMSATMKVGAAGESISLGGRLRLDDGAITEGVFCGSNIQITELATLENLTLAYTSDATTETWSGATTIRNPEEPGNPFSAAMAMTFTGSTLTAASLTAPVLKLGNLLTLANVSFSYFDDGDAVTWQFAATVVRPGPDGTMSGQLDVSGGRIVGGSLSVSNITFGNAFTLDNLEIEYVGRRALSDAPAEGATELQFDAGSSTGSCASTPSGGNVPSGTPTVSGAESYFRVDATATSNDSTFGAAGTIAFAAGKVSMFDISVSCVPVGDWVTIEDLRVAYTDEGSYLLAARLGNDDPTAPSTAIRGLANFVDGRLVGGQLNITDVSLGATVLKEFDLTLGQQPDGTSQWGLAVEVVNGDGDTVSGAGSVTIAAGRIVAGSLTIPELSIADIIEVRDLSLGFDASQPGKLRLHGSAGVGKPGSGGSLAVDVTFEEGRIVAGSFSADRVKLFEMIPVSSFAIGYTAGATKADPGSWSGSFGSEPQAGSSGPSIQAGFEIRSGRLVSGMIGFDGDGDGNPDAPDGSGNAPASGSGSFAGLPLRAFYLRYCAVGSDAAFCSDIPDSESAWDGRIRIELQSESAPSLDGALRVRNGKFASASIALSGINIPIFTGVFLTSIEASLEIDPRFRMCGGIGVSVGPAALTVARIDASFSFSEEFSDYPMETPDGCELTESVDIPDDVEPDYHRILVQGDATLFPGNPLGINITGSAYVDIQTRGYLGVGAQLDLELLRRILSVRGYVEGSLFNANNVDAFHPDTGEQLTGAHAQISGGLAAVLLGKSVASAEFVVNTIGFAACARLGVRVGVGKYWSGGRTRFTCDLGRFRIIVPGTATFADGAGFTAALTEGETPDSIFEVEAGESVLGVDVYSESGDPDAILFSPDGTSYQSPSDARGDEVLIGDTDNQRLFVIQNPQAGEWTVKAAPGSPLLSKITTYHELPEPAVTGEVDTSGGDFKLRYDVTDIPGQNVMFVEREVGEAAMATLGRVESDRGPLTAQLQSAGTVDPVTGQLTQTRSLESTGTTTGEVVFRPSGVPGGGQREIVALVNQDGLPRTELVVATYTAPEATEAAAPTAVAATPTATGATVTWAPPTNDGGRMVRGYRISSTRGSAVTAAFDDTTAELPIPLMTPGETVTVFVEAYTSRGWGAAGTATFTATTASGMQYAPLQAAAGAAQQPGSTPIVTQEFIPTAPATQPPATQPPTTQPPATPTPTQPPTTQTPTPQPPAPTVPGGVLPTTGGSSPTDLGVLATLIALAGMILLAAARRRRAFEHAT